MSSDTLAFIVECIILLLVAPYVEGLSKEWMKSFSEWQAYDRWLMSQEEELYERLGEWKDVADRIDRGEHPYSSMTDALTQEMGKVAHSMIIHLENELTHIREQRS